MRCGAGRGCSSRPGAGWRRNGKRPRARQDRGRAPARARRRPGRRARPGRSPPAGTPRSARPPDAGERSRPGPARARRSPRTGRPGRAAAPPGGAYSPLSRSGRRVRRGPARRLSLAEAHQGEQQQGPCPRDEQVRVWQELGQLLGGPEGGQRIGVPATRQLQPPADIVHPQPRRWLGFGSDGALGALDPGLGLLGPPLPGQHGSEHHVGGAGGGLVGPAVPPGQLDRLPAALPPRGEGPVISIAARWARPLNSRNGRPIRRASATPCSRCRSASSNRAAHTRWCRS